MSNPTPTRPKQPRARRSADSQVRKPQQQREAAFQMMELFSKSYDLYPTLSGQKSGESLMNAILQKDADTEARSKQGVTPGRKAHPFKFDRTAEFKSMNPHHSACIDAKVISTVGLGHENASVANLLDPLCAISWQHTERQLDEDLENTGNAYLEVIRENPAEPNSAIVGLHWMPARDVWIHIENARYDMHFEILDRGGLSTSQGGTADRVFAKFGDTFGPQNFFERHPNSNPEITSELIHFMEPSALSRFYGVPNWLAAIAYVELAQAMVQHQFDFHINRGVPEFMLFILGARLKKEDWQKVTSSLKAQIGGGNSHKSIALNIANPDIEIQLEKLALEAASDAEMFKNMMETLAMSIVSAHRVPPALAQILIPGKMGASNEMSNAVISFQGLVIGPKQKIFEDTLACTLGDSGRNGGLGLGRDSFTLNTVVDEMAEALEKLKPLDTMGGMRQGMGEAAQEGRDLNAGLRKRLEAGDWDRDDARSFIQWITKAAS